MLARNTKLTTTFNFVAVAATALSLSVASLVAAAPAVACQPPDPPFVVPDIVNDRPLVGTVALEPVTVMDVKHDDGDDVMLQINVMSGGCTHADDFDVIMSNPRKGGPQEVRIIRKRADTCEAYAPDGTKLLVRADGIDVNRRIVVMNPLFVGDH